MSLSDSNDLPDPRYFRVEMANVDRDLARARRYLCALNAADNVALNAIMVEIVMSGRGAETLAAMAQQVIDFARVLDANGLLCIEPNEAVSFQQWIEAAAMGQLDVAEDDLRELDGE
jgi:hypothetical protein